MPLTNSLTHDRVKYNTPNVARLQSPMIVKVGPFCRKGLCLVGPFCRKGLSPQGAPPWGAHPLQVAAWPSFRPRLVAGRGVAAKSCSASRTYRNRRLHPEQMCDPWWFALRRNSVIIRSRTWKHFRAGAVRNVVVPGRSSTRFLCPISESFS